MVGSFNTCDQIWVRAVCVGVIAQVLGTEVSRARRGSARRSSFPDGVSGRDGNGIRVNGARQSQAQLTDGDVIELGRTRLKFESAQA